MNDVNSNLEEVFQALSDNTRLRMVSLMLRTGVELCLCDFKESMKEPEYKLSRQLKVLKNVGLISSARDGKWIYHSLIRNSEAWKLVLRAIEIEPPSAEQEKDLVRFKKRKVERIKGRCRENNETNSISGVI